MRHKSICFNPFTRHYNTSRRGGGMRGTNCLGDMTPPTWETGSVYHFKPLVQRTVGDLLLILTIFVASYRSALNEPISSLYCITNHVL